ncbi:MAG TPA: DsrE family protein [Usitatibacter sp.]|nr:DsrE family protein [Usitatibacter sp.]
MIQRIIRGAAAAAVLAFAASGAALADTPIKVVYHVNEGVEKAPLILHNIANELDAEPNTKIVVVAHGKGIDFLLDGAKDKNGNPFDAEVDTLVARGVQFRVCNNTLKSRHIDPKQVIMGAKIVPSGVAEIARLEAKEGYVYLKP